MAIADVLPVLLDLTLMEKSAVTRRFYFTHHVVVHGALVSGMWRMSVEVFPLTQLDGGFLETNMLPISSAIIMKVVELRFDIMESNPLPDLTCITVHHECV